MYKEGISVVLLVLNNSKVIEKALESIALNAPDQVIVVDGSSDDSTVEIAKRYTDDVFVSKRGKWNQQKVALTKIKYKYIIFTEVDHVYPKGFFKQYVEEFKSSNFFGMGGTLKCYFQNNFFEKGINEFYKIHHAIKGERDIIGGPAIFEAERYIEVVDLEGWNGYSVDTRRAQIFAEKKLKLGQAYSEAYQYQELNFRRFFKKYFSYGLGDYVFYSYNKKNWTFKRKAKSIFHVFNRYIIDYPLKSFCFGRPHIAIPYLWASAFIRYYGWLYAFIKGRV